MLSRFANIRSQGAPKCVVPVFQRIAAVHTSAPSNKEDVSKREFPPPTSKRDFVNFPRLVIREERPAVRLGFIPETWFTFFYPKTGYTGPYTFLITVGTYLLSKEKLVIDEALIQALGFGLLMFVITKKLGGRISKAVEKMQDEDAKILESHQEGEKNQILEDIKALEQNDTVKKAIDEAAIAKKEFVLMQMEVAYRERIAETFKTIKNRLDCMAALQSVERLNTHKNLVDYVLRNVNKAITPELEKNVMQNCISQLNALAAKV